MSIEKVEDLFVGVCDCCGRELPGKEDFFAAIRAKKQAGWKSRKIDKHWEDACPECQDESQSSHKSHTPSTQP